MKKLLVLSAMAALAFNAMGQGQVQFNNRDTTVTPNVNAAIYLDLVGGTALSGANYRAALLGGIAGATPFTISAAGVSGGAGLSLLASPNSGNTWVTFRTGLAAGFVAVGSDAARTVAGVDWNGSALVQVVAWSGGFNTFQEALAAAMTDPTIKIGASNPLTLTLPSGPTDPVVRTLQGLQSFAIVAVPEPSTFALAGLGAAAMMIFRRRK